MRRKNIGKKPFSAVAFMSLLAISTVRYLIRSLKKNQKIMKKYLICACLIVVACNKSSDISPKGDLEINKAAPSDSASLAPLARISTNGCWTEYRIKSVYESNYAHWCQLWASPLTSYERQNACGPVAYMIAAHMIAAASNLSFMPSSGSKLDAIVNHIGSLPISITQICSYVTAYDKPPLTSTLYSTESRTDFKNSIESELAAGNPVIVPIVITTLNKADDIRYTSELQTDNYDIDSSPQPGRPNYVLTSKTNGGYGHFIVVIGISIYNSTGYGLVYYKDPLSNSGATKVCSYTRFLESAKINGSCTEPNCKYYDAVAIKKL